MQLVVEISEDTFFDLKKKQNRTEVDNAVLNGTPLDKIRAEILEEKRKNTNMEYDKIFELCILIIEKYMDEEV